MIILLLHRRTPQVRLLAPRDQPFPQPVQSNLCPSFFSPVIIDIAANVNIFLLLSSLGVQFKKGYQGAVQCSHIHSVTVFTYYVSQRSRGLSWSPSNYEELGWKRYFLMSEWDQNRTRASVAIDINARLYSVAIMYPLWLPHSHNMTDFCAFLTYFYHLSHTAVTVIIQTGPSRVPNLPHIQDCW